MPGLDAGAGTRQTRTGADKPLFVAVGGMFLDQQRMQTGISLLFAPGERPGAEAIAAILGAGDAALPGALISHRPPEAEGWIELLASGLTFELHGLAPASAMPLWLPAQRFGFECEPAGDSEGVALVTGPHIAAGAAMMPVVRTITGLAASLAMLLPVRAICWEPAQTWMEPRYFMRAIVGWLAGGPFPALGLTRVTQEQDGFMTSTGLGFFSGQEVQVAIGAGEAPAVTARLAIRVIDSIIRRGRIDRRTVLEVAVEGGAAPGTLIAEPSPDGARVTVWRGR